MCKILLTDQTIFDKLEAHKKGLKHFAFSIFMFNSNGELLLQKRAKNKYHSSGLWSNTCCSHFTKKNDIKNRKQVAKKRLFEELGVRFNGELNEIFVFEYNAMVGQDLIENEFDYVFKGKLNDDECIFSINKEEVEEIKFVNIEWLKNDIKLNPDKYTEWLKLIVKEKYKILFS
jgi:isopentenyl-diphosphate delta-isomerase